MKHQPSTAAKIGQYLFKSVKSFIFYFLIFALMTLIIYLTRENKELTVSELYVEGAFVKIALFFLAFALIYPAIGYIKKEVYLNNDYDQNADAINKIFIGLDYSKTAEDNETVTFRPNKKLTRAMRLFEDKIVIDKTENPIVMEGVRKEVYRIARAIEYQTTKLDNAS